MVDAVSMPTPTRIYDSTRARAEKSIHIVVARSEITTCMCASVVMSKELRRVCTLIDLVIHSSFEHTPAAFTNRTALNGRFFLQDSLLETP